MSPELEALLQALWERENSEPAELLNHTRRVEELIAEALRTGPGISRDEFMAALMVRYAAFRRSQRRHSSLPPRA
jgi:hypothetical protein